MQKIYALILNYNSSEDTISLFKDLLHFHPEELEILIIDNKSTPSEQKRLKNNIPHRNILFNTNNLGYAGGNNIGIDLALREEADFIWILNPDIRIEENTFSFLLNTLETNDNIAAVGPRILKKENNNRIFSDGGIVLNDEKCSTLHKHSNANALDYPPQVDFEISYVDGSCILINTEAIHQIGKFPEEYFLYFEETDWCTQAKLKNYQLAVNSHARVYCGNSEKGKVYNFYTVRNRLLFAKKFSMNYRKVRKYYGNILFMEFLNRFRGKFFSPFYKSKVKGYLAGVRLTYFQ